MTEQDNWNLLSAEVNHWAEYNFGPCKPYWAFLGLVEEIGEFEEVHASMNLDRTAMAKDSFADQAIFVANLVFQLDIHFPAGVEKYNKWFSRSHILMALGKCAKALLKYDQGIRGYDQAVMRNQMSAGLDMWRRWADSQLVDYGFGSLLDITKPVWGEVRLRDWKAYPLTGRAP